MQLPKIEELIYPHNTIKTVTDGKMADQIISKRAISYDESKFLDAIKFICYLFNIEKIYDDQCSVIKAFINGYDVYMSANTGYGKSLCFQALPFVVDALENQCYGISTLIVVSPQKALMEDQVRKMSDCGVSAVALHDQAINLAEKIGNVQAGHYSLVYTSPECILSKDIWRSLISSQEFRDHCIGVAIDEAHCISQW